MCLFFYALKPANIYPKINMATNNNEQVGISIDLGVAGGDNVTAVTKQIQTMNGAIESGTASFKAQLKAAKETALALQMDGKANTKAYRDQLTIIAQLTDEQQALTRATAAFDPGNKFTAISKVASLTAGAFGAVSGALVIMGVSSETAEASIAKLNSISSIIGLLDQFGDAQDVLKPFLANLFASTTATEAQAVVTTEATTATVANTVATTANATALEATTVATEGQIVVTEASVVATEGATVASKALKIALFSLGIGAVIALVSYLVANWDELKKSVTGLFPALDGVGDLFTKTKNIIIGVGNSIFQFLVKPFTGLFKLIKGDFKGALNDFQSALNVTGNFQSGKLVGELNDTKKANKAKLEDDVKYLEQRVKVLKASGGNTDKIERDLYLKKLELNKDDLKKYKEIVNEKEVFEATSAKKIKDEKDKLAKEKATKDKAIADKLKADNEAKLKADLDAIKKNNTEALKVIAEGANSERSIAQTDLDLKYKDEFDALNKRKSTIKDFNKQFANLTEAKKIEEQRLNTKYDDAINDYLKGVGVETISSYQKTRDEINKIVDDLLKNATPQQALALNASRVEQVTKITKLETLDNESKSASTNLTDVEVDNRENEKDTPEVAKQKVLAINQAKLDAENASFQLKKEQLTGQNAELLELQANHEKSLTDITDSNTKARSEFSKKESEAKLATLDAVSAGLNTASGILGENTVASKTLAVASATISTYSAIAGQLQAFSKIPIPGYAIAQAVATGVAGFAAIKNIMKVKVPASGGGSAGGGLSAPVINSTILSKNASGTDDVVNAVTANKPSDQRVYILEKDLVKNESKRKVIIDNSTY